MNVEIGAETAQFPEKEYINGIFVAVHILEELRVASVLNILVPLQQTLVYHRTMEPPLPPIPSTQLGKIGSPWGTDPLALIPPHSLYWVSLNPKEIQRGELL
jgi:hypothetical protein